MTPLNILGLKDYLNVMSNSSPTINQIHFQYKPDEAILINISFVVVKIELCRRKILAKYAVEFLESNRSAPNIADVMFH